MLGEIPIDETVFDIDIAMRRGRCDAQEEWLPCIQSIVEKAVGLFCEYISRILSFIAHGWILIPLKRRIQILVGVRI